MRRFFAATLLVFLLLPALVWAAKCTRVLPKEVFEYFNQKSSDVDCEDYEYKMLDLNDDEQLEIAVTNYRKSCEDAGYCNFEIFEKDKHGWKHIATVPGRLRMLTTTTNGYHDLATWLMGHSYVYTWNGKTYENAAADPFNEQKSEPPKAVEPAPTPAPDATPAP
ncbi:MAG TPA: hypothetical protein PK961_03005 [bacterium]|nr:hypothetical protein [bacterium]